MLSRLRRSIGPTAARSPGAASHQPPNPPLSRIVPQTPITRSARVQPDSRCVICTHDIHRVFDATEQDRPPDRPRITSPSHRTEPPSAFRPRSWQPRTRGFFCPTPQARMTNGAQAVEIDHRCRTFHHGLPHERHGMAIYPPPRRGARFSFDIPPERCARQCPAIYQRKWPPQRPDHPRTHDSDLLHVISSGCLVVPRQARPGFDLFPVRP